MACFVFRWIPASAGMTWGPGEWGGASGGGVGLVAPSGVAALCSAESCEGFGRVGDDSPFAFGGVGVRRMRMRVRLLYRDFVCRDL